MAPIAPETRVGAAELIVSDLERSRRFYLDVVGLEEVDGAGGGVALGAGGEALVVLHGDPAAPPRPRFSSGLFHMAIVVPDRVELGRALLRLADRGWHLDGASDHLVSEALYLSDPDGIGIEIYRDRPRGEWTVRDGQVAMATLPLDLDSIAAEARGAGTPKVAPRTRMGHVHLNVAELTAAEAFYGPAGLGFDVTARNYPGALFLSAGGYHHHIGLNTWRGEGAPPPPEGAIGLRRFTLQVPAAEPEDLTDPSGNALVVRPAPGAGGAA